MYQQFESKRHTINEAVLFELAFAFKLSVRQISHRNIGYKFKFYERVDEKEWEKINNNGANKDRLFHALKFQFNKLSPVFQLKRLSHGDMQKIWIY